MGQSDPDKVTGSAPQVTVTARHLLPLSVAALWGASFLFVRIASPALGPPRLVQVRMALAGVALLGYALPTRRRRNLASRSWQWLVIGALLALPLLLIAVVERHLTASLVAVLSTTTPLFATLVAAIWLHHRLTTAKAAGLLLGAAQRPGRGRLKPTCPQHTGGACRCRAGDQAMAVGEAHPSELIGRRSSWHS